MRDSAVGVGKIQRDIYVLKEGDTEQSLLASIMEGKREPDSTKVSHNVWLTIGWTEILKLVTGESSDHFDFSNTTIGVGDDSTTASASQSDLLATTNKTYKGMTTGYPTTPTSGTVTFKAVFMTSEANYAHNELVVKNQTSGLCWNRNATGWGTKTSSEIWSYTVTLGKA